MFKKGKRETYIESLHSKTKKRDNSFQIEDINGKMKGLENLSNFKVTLM